MSRNPVNPQTNGISVNPIRKSRGSNPGLEFSLYPQQLLDGLEQDEHESEEELDDVHICGTCKIQFNSIDAFVDHKQTHQRSRSKKSSFVSVPIPESETSKEFSEASILATDEAAVISLLANQLNSHINHGQVQHQQQQQQQFSRISNNISSHGFKSSRQSVTGGVTLPEDVTLTPVNDPREGEQIQIPQTVFEQFHRTSLTQSSNETSNPIEEHQYSEPPKPYRKPEKVRFAPSQDQRKVVLTTTTTNSGGPDVRTVVKVTKGGGGNRQLYSCSVVGCNFSSVYSKDLVRHMRTHTGEKPYSCSECGKKFSRQDKLKNHSRIHSGDKPFKCQLCAYATSDSGSLKKHIRVHTDDRPFQCQICPYRSKDSSQLTVHLRSHTGDCPFVCPFENCSTSFKTNSDLKRHTRTHTGEKPYTCPQCPYRCAIKSNIKNHIAANHRENSRAFNCKLCDFHTGNKIEFKSHEKSHTALSFNCPQCDFTATSKLSLTSHVRKSHSSSNNKFNCLYCNFTCKWEGALTAHVNKKHTNAKAIRKRKFSKKKADLPIIAPPTVLKGNKPKDKTSVKNLGDKKIIRKSMSGSGAKSVCDPHFKCNYCDASFVRKDSLQSHLRQHIKQQQQQQQQQQTSASSGRVTNDQPKESKLTQISEETITAVHQDGPELLTLSSPINPNIQFIKTDAVLGSTAIILHNQGQNGSGQQQIQYTLQQDLMGEQNSEGQTSQGAIYFSGTPYAIDQGASQAAHILSAFKFEDLYHNLQQPKLVTSSEFAMTPSLSTLTAAGPTTIQYVLTSANATSEMQLVHPSTSHVLLQSMSSQMQSNENK